MFDYKRGNRPWKTIKNTDGTVSPVHSIKELSRPLYALEKWDGYIVLDSKGGKVLAREVQNPNRLCIKDGAGSFSFVWAFPNSNIRAGLITDNGTLIIIGDNGDVRRSTNQVDFNLVLSGVIPPMHSTGLDNNGDIICFSTYSNPSQEDNIYTSLDDGQTWSATLTIPAGNVAHFHTCQWLRPRLKWIATTGDGVMRWYESPDGVNWNLIVDSTDQTFRTLGVSAKSRHELLWSSDGGIGHEGVWETNTRNTNEIGDVTRSLLLSSTSYSFNGWINLAMVANFQTGTYKKNQKSFLWATINGGETWELLYFITPASANYGGFYDIIGPDEQGIFYAVATNSSDFSGTLVCKPNYLPDKLPQ